MASPGDVNARLAAAAAATAVGVRHAADADALAFADDADSSTTPVRGAISIDGDCSMSLLEDVGPDEVGGAGLFADAKWSSAASCAMARCAAAACASSFAAAEFLASAAAVAVPFTGPALVGKGGGVTYGGRK